MTDVPTMIAAMSAAQKDALQKSGATELLPSQSDRGTLSGLPALVDYSFRPARLTQLGRAVKDYLMSGEAA